MTNEELKEKIVSIVRGAMAEADELPFIETTDNIADALIAAGIGDVKEAVKDFAKKITVLIKGTMGMGSTDFWKGYNKAKYDVIEIIKQAEKELEEEENEQT
jgi:hypothetical protein